MLQGCMEAAKLLHYTKDIQTMQDADMIANTIFAECYSTMEEAVRIISKKCGKWTIFEDYNEIDGKALRQFKLHMEKYPLTPIPEVVGGWYVQPNDTFEESLTINGFKQLLYYSCCCVIDCVECSNIDANKLKIDEPSTERAKKYFARAVEAGYMIKTTTGYKWTNLEANGGKAQLGYFLDKVYNPDRTKTIPYKALEKLFGVDRLDSTVYSNYNTKYPDRQKWRKEIDELFLD